MGTETRRVDAFSDGVFAIAITLLGLTLRPPARDHESLLRLLVDGWPRFLSFFTSFATVGIVWIHHHRLFTYIRRLSHGLLLWNGLLLMSVTLMPFSTDVVATSVGGADGTTAAQVYAANSFFIWVSFSLLWRHATRTRQLVDRYLSPKNVRRIDWQYALGAASYILSFFIAFAGAVASVLFDVMLAGVLSMPALALGTLSPPSERTTRRAREMRHSLAST